MRILVIQPATGSATLERGLPRAVSNRVHLTLMALLRDLNDIPGVEALAILPAGWEAAELPGEVRYAKNRRDGYSLWTQGLRDCDAVWPVAPRPSALAAYFGEQALLAGRLLLSCRPQAIRALLSKRRMNEALSSHRVPVIAMVSPLAVTGWRERWVVKPDDGFGCLGIRIIASEEEAARFLTGVDGRAYVAQPYLSGTAVGLSLLCSERRCRVLSADLRRTVVINDEFSLLGEIVNGAAVQQVDYELLATAVVGAVPGMWGIAGIELLLTAQGPRVLGVTPGLPGAYPALRESLGTNPAALVLALVGNEEQAFDSPLQALPVELDFNAAH